MFSWMQLGNFISLVKISSRRTHTQHKNTGTNSDLEICNWVSLVRKIGIGGYWSKQTYDILTSFKVNSGLDRHTICLVQVSTRFGWRVIFVQL